MLLPYPTETTLKMERTNSVQILFLHQEFDCPFFIIKYFERKVKFIDRAKNEVYVIGFKDVAS